MDPIQSPHPIEEQFRIMADSAPVLIWISGTDKLCYFFNAGWFRFTGRSLEQEYGNGWAEGVHPDDLQLCLDIYIRSFDARKEFKMEYRLRRHDGVYRWLLDTGIPRYAADGAFTGYIGSCIDIDELLESQQAIKNIIHTEAVENEQALNEELTASNEELVAINEEMTAANEELTETHEYLQQALHKLAESESRLSIAIAATQLGTWDWNPGSHTLYLSEECRAILALPAAGDVSLETVAGFIFRDDREKVKREMQRSLDHQEDTRFDLSCRILRPDDAGLRWIRIQGLVHVDAGGNAIRFVGTLLDRTEEKLAEEKSAKLAAIIESSDDAIISKTLDSVITSWNDSAQRIFGYAADEMIGESIYKLIPEDRKQEEPEIIARLKSGERVEHFETKRMTKDGRLIDVSVTVSPLYDSQRNIIGLSKIARDITERKLDESRKTDFIGMASHELKTPITSLAAIIQLANIKLKHSEDPFLVGAMDKAYKQVTRMTSLINGFLNVSRLETGKIHIDKQFFDLDGLITETVDEMMLTVSSHRINFGSSGPVPVYADQDKIGSVLTNLISNAVKYSPQGKVINVKCERIGDRAQVSVNDEGMGIRPEDINHVFDRYYRAINPHTRHISGFGIGLYLSAEIIRRHEGRIWVESESGVGSTFYFSFTLQ